MFRNTTGPFDWRGLLRRTLGPWDNPSRDDRITREDLDDFEDECERGEGLIFCTRVQIVQGRLYIRDVRALEFDRDYAVSRLAPLIHLLKAHPDLPDVDLLLALNDHPRSALNLFVEPGGRRRPPPVFGATSDPQHVDIPWPDYSFWLPARPHKTRTEPWGRASARILRAARTIPWAQRHNWAFFAGDTRHPARQDMAKVANASEHQHLFRMRTVWIHKAETRCGGADVMAPGWHGVRCHFEPEDYCQHRFLLNLGSGGHYANKLKYLMLCGSLVIHVARENMVHAAAPPAPRALVCSSCARACWAQASEFWQPLFVAGEHYLAVERAAEVPALVRQLTTDPVAAAAAERIARAGQARMAALTEAEVLRYCEMTLRKYASLLKFKPKPEPGGLEINCVDDLWRHYEKDVLQPWFAKMLTEDNSSCIRRPEAPFLPPGYGGAYLGTKVQCVAANNYVLRQERCFPPANTTAERLAFLDRIYNDHCSTPCRVPGEWGQHQRELARQGPRVLHIPPRRGARPPNATASG